MAGETKTSFKMYSAWNYQKEIEDLNKASLEGWQLKKGGGFHSTFVKNPDVCYRYQLDYGRIDDMGRYIETFREQGWEYVNSTFNGWHYLRKLYDPSLPEEAYEIFTDRQSLQEMNRRWARFALIIGLILAAFAIFWAVRVIMKPNWPRILRLITFGFESGVLIFGSLVIMNPDAKRAAEETTCSSSFSLWAFFWAPSVRSFWMPNGRISRPTRRRGPSTCRLRMKTG